MFTPPHNKKALKRKISALKHINNIIIVSDYVNKANKKVTHVGDLIIFLLTLYQLW